MSWGLLMRRSFIAAAFILVCSAAMAQSVGPLPPLTANIDVNIVNVDVTVTDENGEPITGLRMDDFEVYEDGQPQKITNFYVIERSVIRRQATDGTNSQSSPAEGEQFRRKVFLVVDNNYIDKVQRDRALNKVEQFMEKSFGGDYEWSVAMIGHGLTTVQPLTNDKALLRAAIQKVRTTPAFSSHFEIDRGILSDRTRKSLDTAAEYDYGEAIRFRVREQTFRNLRSITNTAHALAETVRGFGATDGKKLMILINGGMESNTTFRGWEKEDDPELRELRLEIVKTIDAMTREANAANFAVHIINARQRGMIAPQHNAENHSSGINLNGNNLLRKPVGTDPIDTTDEDSHGLMLAGRTGGTYTTAPVEKALTAIETRTANFYSLGYSPGHDDDRRYHTIKVRVKRPGVSILHRPGYVALSQGDRLEQYLKARVSFENPIATLPVTVEVGEGTRIERNTSVPFTAALPLERITMLPVDGLYVGRVHVYVSVFDSAGNNVGFEHKMQEVKITPSQLQNISEEAFRYHVKVRLAKGDFKVVVTLRDDLSNEIGSAVRPIRMDS